MKFVPSSREDITRYFRGTYIKLKERGDELFFIEQVDSLRVTGKHESGEQFIIYMDEDTPFTIDYVLPHKSFFQMGKDAVLLERLPQKQYQRGLSENNTSLKYMSNSNIVKNVGLSFDTLKKFVSKQPFFSLLKAINETELSSCVLSPRMMYHRTKKEIFIDLIPVARVNPQKLIVYVLRPIFLDEIKEFIQNSGETVWKIEIAPPQLQKELKPIPKPEVLLKKKVMAPQFFADGVVMEPHVIDQLNQVDENP